MTFLDASTSKVKKVKEYVASCRGSRKLILFIVFIAIFLDNMLLTTVVPIVPNFILKLEQQSEPKRNVTEIDIVCEDRTILNDDQVIGFNISDIQFTTKNPKECKSERNETAEKILKKEAKEEEYAEYGDANVKAGIMFGSKALVQMLFNPFVGPITNRIGYTIPMFTGFVIMMTSTVIFAFGETYAVLFVARAFQGIGSACSSVAGMGMLACRYTDDDERGRAMGIALGGLALGVLIGPPFGGVMYQFAGKEAPFLILAALALFDGALQMFVLQPTVQPESQEGTSYITLLKDPYILIAAGSITFANMGIAMMEPSLPIWMNKVMGAEEWEQGLAFLPASISYLLGTNIFGPVASKIGRWLSTMLGMIVISICLFATPFCRTTALLIAPMFGLGFSIGMVDASMMPHMGYLVDLRHVSVYGNVYAIADIAFAMGFAVGPMMSGTIVKAIGFSWMLWIIAIASFIYTPLIVLLRNPPGKEEKMSLIMNEQCPVQYVTYNQTQTSNLVSEDEDGYYK
ncbi:synaptic vesicular amine transporter-like [Ruditapes philippinarum]|uniref:synaptic vesicular amine transporter-like n=1 Tax=Ruditapes philippinarum TaxID=129788 RepID=UPI00295AFAA3|nr:synaptic vesicular amine transporter-like [Ruditapes philippinarum]